MWRAPGTMALSEMDTMTIPTIFETCRPRKDVIQGGIAEADFAADLASVVSNRASSEYLDPTRFFADTYPTRGLKNLLHNVCQHLAGTGGEVASIFRLDTSYGGGKTHGLIALTHAARGLGAVPNVTEFVDPALLPQGPVRIAAFDWEIADPANGRRMDYGVLAHTPWGEIACAFAGKDGYERVRKSDESRTAPGAETLRELFGGEPTLILLGRALGLPAQGAAQRGQRRSAHRVPHLAVQGSRPSGSYSESSPRCGAGRTCAASSKVARRWSARRPPIGWGWQCTGPIRGTH